VGGRAGGSAASPTIDSCFDGRLFCGLDFHRRLTSHDWWLVDTSENKQTTNRTNFIRSTPKTRPRPHTITRAAKGLRGNGCRPLWSQSTAGHIPTAFPAFFPLKLAGIFAMVNCLFSDDIYLNVDYIACQGKRRMDKAQQLSHKNSTNLSPGPKQRERSRRPTKKTGRKERLTGVRQYPINPGHHLGCWQTPADLLQPVGCDYWSPWPISVLLSCWNLLESCLARWNNSSKKQPPRTCIFQILAKAMYRFDRPTTNEREGGGNFPGTFKQYDKRPSARRREKWWFDFRGADQTFETSPKRFHCKMQTFQI